MISKSCFIIELFVLRYASLVKG